MQNRSLKNIAVHAKEYKGKQNDRNFEVHVEEVKSWKDGKEHEKIRRQRQDLFDFWELGIESLHLKHKGIYARSLSRET